MLPPRLEGAALLLYERWLQAQRQIVSEPDLTLDPGDQTDFVRVLAVWRRVAVDPGPIHAELGADGSGPGSIGRAGDGHGHEDDDQAR
jgi:hypothetical protein